MGAKETNKNEAGTPRRAQAKRDKFSFRVTPQMRKHLEDVSAKTGRPVSEELELRIERTFIEDNIAQLSGQTVMDLYNQVAKEAIHSAFKEYERIIIGHRDGFNFGHWMGKALAAAVIEIKSKAPKDKIWYDDRDLLKLVRAAAQNRLDYLFEDYRRIEYTGNRTEVFSQVCPIVINNTADGVYKREAIEAQVQIEIDDAAQRAWIEAGRPGLTADNTES